MVSIQKQENMWGWLEGWLQNDLIMVALRNVLVRQDYGVENHQFRLDTYPLTCKDRETRKEERGGWRKRGSEEEGKVRIDACMIFTITMNTNRNTPSTDATSAE